MVKCLRRGNKVFGKEKRQNKILKKLFYCSFADIFHVSMAIYPTSDVGSEQEIYDIFIKQTINKWL